MKVKNNYDECLTNLACSIKKYFGLNYTHKTINYIDKILEEKQPINVVVILLDGMGSRILERTLDKNSFFIKNKYKDITTVFPATTTAATYSIQTGLNPMEHGYLGWHNYIKPLNKVIKTFTGEEKVTKKLITEYQDIKDNIMISKTIVDELIEGNYQKSRSILPFGNNKYNDLDDMINIIKKQCSIKEKKYIYAYNDEPDHTMHDYGPDSKEAKELIIERNNKIEKLCNELSDTIVFIIADHGHIKVDNINLDDYPEITNLLERTTSIEQRAVSFKIKEGKQKEFEDKFNTLFGEYFNLYNKKDIIDSNLFGDGIINPLFEDSIGDYIAIAENSNKALYTKGDTVLTSQHAGYTDDEIYIPLIIVDKTKK